MKSKLTIWHGWLLAAVLGMALGFVQAAGLLETRSAYDADSDTVASINGADIRLLDYLRALKLLDDDKREVLTQADANLVLERMIEEELLLQYAISHNLAREPQVRQVIQQAVLDSVMNDVSAQQPSETQLLDFYREHIQPLTALAPPFIDGQLDPQWQSALMQAWLDNERSQQLKSYLLKLRHRADIQMLGPLRHEDPVDG